MGAEAPNWGSSEPLRPNQLKEADQVFAKVEVSDADKLRAALNTQNDLIVAQEFHRMGELFPVTLPDGKRVTRISGDLSEKIAIVVRDVEGRLQEKGLGGVVVEIESEKGIEPSGEVPHISSSTEALLRQMVDFGDY